MEGKRAGEKIYTQADCEAVGAEISLKGKVMVLDSAASKKGPGHQLAFCIGGGRADANPKYPWVFYVDLKDGDVMRCNRKGILGLLKPQLLPEEEKLQLSQIRPIGARPLEGHTPLYSGYSFLEDGRYAAGVGLCSEQEVFDYVDMQMPYQHRVMICDSYDFCVMEVIDGKQTFPDMEEWKRNQKLEACGEMEIR